MTIKMKPVPEKSYPQNEGSRIQVFVQQMLMTRIFAASYIGRFYVESLKDYRDVIQIYEEEKDLIRDLVVVKKRVNNFYKGTLWAAVTEPGEMDSVPSGHCIWVRLLNVPYGDFWFTIEDVAFSGGAEVVINVKVLRKFEPDVTAKVGPIKWDEIRDDMLNSARDLLTWENMKESFRFIFVLLVGIVTVFIYGVQYLGEYSLRFFKEFNNLIKVLTPIFLAVLDMLTKTIGGFYILIAMLWRGGAPHAPPGMYPSLQAPPPRQFRPMRTPPYQRKPHYES